MMKYNLTLNTRERWLLARMWEGRKFVNLARDYNMPVQTMKNIARGIYLKTGAGNRVEAVTFAIELGWLHKTEFYGS